MPRNKPLYIAFEGGEGAGKSTQARLLVERIGESAILTREPGGTSAGSRLREILLSPDTGDLDPMAEAYLMAADRAQLATEVIQPSLAQRKHVITDRTFVSSVAYQGAGRGLGEQKIMDLNLMNQQLLLPDIILVLMPPSPGELARRMNRDLDRFEQAGIDFHQRVAECFGQIGNALAADSRTSSIHVVNIQPESCGQPKLEDEIGREIALEIEDYCQDSGYFSPF